jgi:diguanylate cyclase (GGDEF)-like protein/PAS domain S-box-containing protein
VEPSASTIALPECERRFRAAFADAAIGLAILDGDGRLTYANPTLCRMSGYQESELYRRKFAEMLHPEDRGETGSLDKERRLLGKDGNVRWVRTTTTVFGEPPEEPQIVTFVEDISLRKQAEGLAEDAVSQLAAIVGCSRDAIVATDTSGAITAWNDGARQLLGYTVSEALALPIAALFTSSDPARQLLSLIHRGQSSRLGEVDFLRGNGSHVPVSLDVSPILKSDGQWTGSVIIAQDISARKKTEREIADQALHDSLTGLPNRLFIGQLLADSIASAHLDTSGTAVIFVDLDGFKFVNDTLGHEAGDALLQQVAQRLSSHVRREDRLARMGGDEFMLVVNDMTEDQVAIGVADRLQDALRAPFFVARHEIVVTASMGISIYPRDGTDVSALRRKADTAMYEAKQAGKDRIRLYSPAMGSACKLRLEMETDLRHALDRDELCLYYQPMYTAADIRQTAYEALLRWPHPSLGFVPPSQFIRLAEETRLIVRLGEWVLHEACRQCRWWQDHGKPMVRVAVNVSPLQFARTDFVDTVFEVLRDTGLSGDLLDLEVTESIVLGDIDGTIRQMDRLRERGVRISVDDFGTGYSSLGYLPKLPVDILKIDRCFVEQIGENAAAVPLIHGMISLAHSIGKRVVVEGIETNRQLEILRNLGCDEVQGFLLGRPAPLTRYRQLPRELAAEQLIV